MPARYLVPALICLLAGCGSGDGSARVGPSGKTTKSAQGSVQSDMNMASQIKIRKRKQYTQEELRERKKPSEIEGLTKGQMDDMPSVPVLPMLFGLRATEAQLEAHAMLTAREDVESGRADLVTIQQRYLYIRYIWMAEWDGRKQRLSNVGKEQSDYAARLRSSAALQAAWERGYNGRQAAHKRALTKAERERFSLLSPEERRLLNQ